MTSIVIDWKHFDKEGNTCVRCSNTGLNIYRAIEELKEKLNKNKITVLVKETKLSENEIQASNSILINGVLIEDLLTDTKRIDTKCGSCCEMIGSNVDCRALSCQGKVTEEIPASLIKKAINNLLRKEGV